MAGAHYIYSDLPKPTFLTGVAKLFDFYSGHINQYEFIGSGYETDCKAIRLDWQAVGQDLYFAMNQFEEIHILDSNV